MHETWKRQALCRLLDLSPDLFFSPHGRHVAIEQSAKRVCRACIVQEDCLNFALNSNIRHGLWGGLTPTERRAERRRRVMLTQPQSIDQSA
jgi:WhiB family transcriptional regulator, redox-sensing transcriptional regulator